ncbi:MAG: HAD-IIA family hydrolase [Anaerolineales bacterium]|nr:HAD-IIA family hydrolase [Anaerolineales bacterium]
MNSPSEFLKNVKLFLLDMDGIIYLDDHLLPGAKEFLAYLEEKNIPFYFLTNNSSRSTEDYVSKLAWLGLDFSSEKVFGSGRAASVYIKQNFPGKKVYLAGTPSLVDEFDKADISLDFAHPDIFVLGFDTTLTYSKLIRVCNLVRSGIPYIATHPDLNCPIKNGFIPDIGAMIAFIAASTGRQPDVIIGKPYSPIVEALVSLSGFQPGEMAMIGDRLYTDIAMGQSGIKTILVMSGETQPEDLRQTEFIPDLIVENLAELHRLMG